MVKVKVVFFAWESIYGKLIRFGTKCKWTHVGIIGSETAEEVTIYEALNKGLVKNTYSKATVHSWIDEGYAVIKEVNLATSKGNLEEICESYLGRPYDWISIVNIAFYVLFGRKALNIKGARLLICSEFVARVLYDYSGGKINFEKEFGKPYDFVTPADLFNSRMLK